MISRKQENAVFEAIFVLVCVFGKEGKKMPGMGWRLLVNIEDTLVMKRK